MHWRTRKKILTVNKVYLTQLHSEFDNFYEIRIQLLSREFVLIALEEPLPQKIFYQSLIHYGFNYDEHRDQPIQIHGKKNTLKILKNPVNYKNNKSKTVEFVIDLVEQMGNLDFYM